MTGSRSARSGSAAAAQLSEALNLSPEGRQEYLRVALAIPPGRRRPELSWSHHRRVAARWLTPAQRDRLLDVAETGRLTSNEMLLHVERLREPIEEESPGTDAERVVSGASDSGSRSGPASDCQALVDDALVRSTPTCSTAGSETP